MRASAPRSELSPPFRLPAGPPAFADGVVSLRQLGVEDVDLVVRGSQDAEVVRWTFMPPRLDAEGASRLLQRWQSLVNDGRARQYAVADASDPAVALGLVTLVLQDASDPRCVDVAYWLLPEGRGRGLITHAVSLMVAWAFEVAGCTRATLYTKLGNDASDAVARRCGFIEAGRRSLTHDGRPLELRRWDRVAP